MSCPCATYHQHRRAYSSAHWLHGSSVQSAFSSVNEMQYNAEFRVVPGGEDLTEIPEYILVKCPLTSRWLTTAQSLVYMWTRKHGRLGKGKLNTLEILVKYCLQVYFKLYYDIKGLPQLEDGPKHILTQLRLMRVASPRRSKRCDLLRADRGMVRTLRMCPPLADGESE
ncbi:hypothetical protein GWK47_006577 [Chionoecetes opilio]|uniref:Uncharacterized protein n=1 Tax=Chionoecetes opilio TaxID=41210 RepID=A0A8J4YB04_CHIOP|nr:hypothetical protein GWK47_006577 [Chionoecetes opilio]